MNELGICVGLLCRWRAAAVRLPSQFLGLKCPNVGVGSNFFFFFLFFLFFFLFTLKSHQNTNAPKDIIFIYNSTVIHIM